ncbi:MAG: ATP-binding protein [Oscillatoriales cyanobacterium RM1_1_9]|nr:ATP-binding protein [Oscillatoriales cyanobacterium SM2_3_0]NJO47684.1 ATP-binding protein [Oscillatoriales cyanobacterium RM2_1_1]NJO71158.1 ATP-binding protein [Oscillatoriales cyanobacterium RM1_1_9]
MKADLDFTAFYKATNPSKTLNLVDQSDRQFYIDFSRVRGQEIIEQLKAQITLFSPDEPTCQLFTGHIGCGKSTELSNLRADLIQAGCHVVYFESDQDLEMNDVDVADILLAIARQVDESLRASQICLQPSRLQELLQGAAKLLNSEVRGVNVGTPGIPGVLPQGKIGVKENQGQFSLSLGIGEITTQAKQSPELRSLLRDYLEPRTKLVIDAINQELIEPAILKLKQQGYQGLVVIVDNLDRLELSSKSWGRPQPEYLFVDRGEQLRQLNCHVVYTMPLVLRFSSDIVRLTSRFGTEPLVLPMVPVQHRDGNPCLEGMALLKQMVLVRAFPHLTPEARLQRLPEIVEFPEILHRLCQVSGGHVRELLGLVRDWIMFERKLPLSSKGLEQVIRDRANKMALPITDQHWELLKRVHRTQSLSGFEEYRILLRSLFVYEYYDDRGSWFAVNPILLETGRLS